MYLTIEQNKKLIEKYPFLQPRNVWTGKVPEDYDYTYINGIGELPIGWEKLFLLFCKHLRDTLIETNYLDKFRFVQIKEKYGSMRLYNSGYPKNSKVSELIYIFEYLSTYVCEDCGRVAKYLTPGWITQLCPKCFFNNYNITEEEKFKFKKTRKNFTLTIEEYKNHTTTFKKYNCKPYWEEYLKCSKMNQDEFFSYILQD